MSLFAGHTQASTYTVDTLLFTADLGNSGAATEESALEAFLKTDVTMDAKADTTVALKDDAGHWYLDVSPGQPGYFVIKFGTGNTGEDNHYYYENIGELTKLVFTNEQVNGLIGTGTTAMRLSHYVTYNGDGRVPPNEVPEPGTLALAGLGLVAAVLSRRRRST